MSRKLYIAAADQWLFKVVIPSNNWTLQNFSLGGRNTQTVSVNYGDGKTDSILLPNANRRSITHLYTVAGTYTVTVKGKISDLRELMLETNTLQFELKKLPKNLDNLTIGSPGVGATGLLADLPRNLTALYLRQCTSVSGSIDNLPSTLVNCTISYCATTFTGNVANLNISMTNLVFSGLGNDVYINVGDLPRSLNSLQLVSTNGHSGGSLANLPRNLTFLDFFGFGTNISGNISDLPSTLVSVRLQITNNLITGDINSLPWNPGSQALRIQGLGLVTGNINTFCTNHIGVKRIEISSLNNITGELGILPAGMEVVYAIGIGNLLTFDTSFTYWSSFIQYKVGNSFIQAKIDWILASVVASGKTSGQLDLRGNSTPSAQGLIDKATLQSRGMTVYTD